MKGRNVGDESFWQSLDMLVASSVIQIDRPRGSSHPRYPHYVYPIDYGYLEDTRSMDGGGIDVWVGSLPRKRVMAVICTIDGGKRDSEVKVLIGCTAEETQVILQAHNQGSQSAILVPRPRMGES